MIGCDTVFYLSYIKIKGTIKRSVSGNCRKSLPLTLGPYDYLEMWRVAATMAALFGKTICLPHPYTTPLPPLHGHAAYSSLPFATALARSPPTAMASLRAFSASQTLMVNNLIDLEWKFGITASTDELESVSENVSPP